MTIPQVIAMGSCAAVQFGAVAVIGLAPSLAAKQDAYLVWLAAIPIYLYIGCSIIKKRANQAYVAVIKRRNH